MTDLTAKLLRELVDASQPNLRFSDLERYFPVRAESWLTHTTSAPWSEEPDDVAALAGDRHLRGTALMDGDPSSGDPEDAKLAGPPNDEDQALRLLIDDEPDSIGNPDYTQPGGSEPFLSFAGWNNPAEPQRGGDLDYLYESFSELASALDHRLAWRPIEQRPNRPTFAHPQPASPAVYCEADWAAVHPRLGLEEFAPGSDKVLAPFLQLTYYYLFAAREPLGEPPQPGVRPLEGQWAAISIFYRVNPPHSELDDDGRPLSVDIDDDAGGSAAFPPPRPEFAAFSLDPRDNKPTSTILRIGTGDCEVYTEPGTLHANVAAYVGAGTHRFFNSPNGDAVVHPPPPWPTLDYEPGSDLEGLVLALLPAIMTFLGATLGSAFIADPVTAIVVGVGAAAVVLAIMIFLWLLLNLLKELWDKDADTSDIPDASDGPIDPGPSAGDPSYGDPVPRAPTRHPARAPAAASTATPPGGGRRTRAHRSLGTSAISTR